MTLVSGFQCASADLVTGLLNHSLNGRVALLDSCGSKSLGSRKLIAGVEPKDVFRLHGADPGRTLARFDQMLGKPDTAAVFTVSYDFGRKLHGLDESAGKTEPDIFIYIFENLIEYDYSTGTATIHGNPAKTEHVERLVRRVSSEPPRFRTEFGTSEASSNFAKAEYLKRVNEIQSRIKSGYTYQTNLTQKLAVRLGEGAQPQGLFARLRSTHPAPFSAFIDRGSDFVLSISPERMVKVDPESNEPRVVEAAPIKGTIERGTGPESDALQIEQLKNSEKDRAENTMIVDLVRNDLGRICEYGTVKVSSLCEIEKHPTLFHMVSTVEGHLRTGICPSDVIKAVFPCGSITGCPKRKTMEIIDELERIPRGLSMGAIGYSGFDKRIDMNVAIRTVVVNNGIAEFNVGGGIVIDSDPEAEYQESMLKAKAILAALNAEFP